MSFATVERTLPNDKASELALLCAALVDPNRVLTETLDLSPAAFHDYRAQALWRIMQNLHAAGSVVDSATVQSAITDPREAEDLPVYLSEVVCSQAGLPCAAADYAKAIEETHRRRKLIELAHDLNEGAFDKSVDLAYIERETLRRLTATIPAPKSLLIVNGYDLVTRPIPEADEIVAGILPAKSKAIISGPAKLGKSRFLTGLLLGVATGRDVMGFTIPKARRVLVLQSEVCERSLQKRLQKIFAGFPCDENLVRDNLLFCHMPLKLTRSDHAAAVAEAVKRTGAEVLAVDPAYRYFTGDENKVADWQPFFDFFDNLIAEQGVAVILCHHHGKAKGEGGNNSTVAHLNRGASTVADWPDSLLTLQWCYREAEIVRLDFTLRNDAEPLPMAFERNPDTLLFDPLPDYQFDGRKRATKITDHNVADAIGKGDGLHYGQLVGILCKRFDVAERTVKSAISRAAEAGKIVKNQKTGLYEKP
jgi:hypothetical protein